MLFKAVKGLLIHLFKYSFAYWKQFLKKIEKIKPL